MGKKSRRRSGHPAGAPPRRRSHATPATSAKPAKRSGLSRTAAAGTGAAIADAFESSVEEMWATIASGDVLEAEMRASVFASMALMAEGSASGLPKLPEDFPAALINSVIEDQFTPQTAAFCRLLVSLGSPALKSEASETLEEHAHEGIYPPHWVTDAGKPVPHRAWRSSDVFGDDEFIIVTFGYGDAEHAIVVGVDLTIVPTVRALSAGRDVDKLITIIRERDEPFERFEEITLAQARCRIEGPLARAGEDLSPDVSYASFLRLPLVRSRMRRLPAGSPGAATRYTAADRAAAVDDFMRSPLAGAAGDADAARFWAQVLTGYSGRVPGEPPAQLGPGKLRAALLWHVPRTFTMTDPRRASMQPAVTAWTRWAAGRQGLDEAATEHVLDHLQKIFADFESAYDNPDSATDRRYVRDLAVAGDVDVGWLTDCRARREFAVPLPEGRQRGQESLDAGDLDHRVVMSVSEFGLCDTGDVPREEFVRAVRRVVEELWHDEPPATWQTVERLRAKGMSRHEIMHTLAG